MAFLPPRFTSCLGRLVGLLALASGVASAAITVYQDKTLYDTAAGGSGYVDNFSSLTPGSHLIYQQSGGSPAFDYTIASAGTLYRNMEPTVHGSWLSTENSDATIVAGFPSLNVSAVGGVFFLTEDDETPVDGAMTVTVHYVNSEFVDYPDLVIPLSTIAGGTFLGVVLTEGDILGGIEITPDGNFATLTNFQVSAIPETGSLLLGTFGLAGLARRRRR